MLAKDTVTALAVELHDPAISEHRFARVKVPDSLPQFIPLKRPRKKSRKRAPRSSHCTS